MAQHCNEAGTITACPEALEMWLRRTALYSGSVLDGFCHCGAVFGSQLEEQSVSLSFNGVFVVQQQQQRLTNHIHTAAILLLCHTQGGNQQVQSIVERKLQQTAIDS